MLKKRPFIEPSVPVLKQSPPTGKGWIHEVKFDGWRVQLHKDGDQATIYSRRGNDLTRRFPFLPDSVLCLPVHSAIIDAELVVSDAQGKPDFSALMAGDSDNICAWCFDLLDEGRDLRRLPLIERKNLLNDLLIDADDHILSYSVEFPDPVELLQAAEKMGLEGVVSKRKDQPYRSGKNPGWVKVKTRTWREANIKRGEMFENRRA